MRFAALVVTAVCCLAACSSTRSARYAEGSGGDAPPAAAQETAQAAGESSTAAREGSTAAAEGSTAAAEGSTAPAEGSTAAAEGAKDTPAEAATAADGAATANANQTASASITGTGTASAPQCGPREAQAREGAVTGKVVGRRGLVLAVGSGDADPVQLIALDEKCVRVDEAGEARSFTQLAEGDRVRAAYRVEGTMRVATEIQIVERSGK